MGVDVGVKVVLMIGSQLLCWITLIIIMIIYLVLQGTRANLDFTIFLTLFMVLLKPLLNHLPASCIIPRCACTRHPVRADSCCCSARQQLPQPNLQQVGNTASKSWKLSLYIWLFCILCTFPEQFEISALCTIKPPPCLRKVRTFLRLVEGRGPQGNRATTSLWLRWWLLRVSILHAISDLENEIRKIYEFLKKSMKLMNLIKALLNVCKFLSELTLSEVPSRPTGLRPKGPQQYTTVRSPAIGKKRVIELVFMHLSLF